MYVSCGVETTQRLGEIVVNVFQVPGIIGLLAENLFPVVIGPRGEPTVWPDPHMSSEARGKHPTESRAVENLRIRKQESYGMVYTEVCSWP